MTYNELASAEALQRTATSLQANNFQSIIVTTKEEALQKIKDLIPAGATIMNGSSRSLEEIGFVEYLKADAHGWRNLHEEVLKETDPEKQALLRKQSVISDYYLGSVHALSEDGELVIASNSGSQLPHIVYTSPNLIFVIGAQKIAPTLASALARVEEYVVPLEDARMKAAYGSGTIYAKTLIFRKENPKSGRTITVLLVNEKLGF